MDEEVNKWTKTEGRGLKDLHPPPPAMTSGISALSREGVVQEISPETSKVAPNRWLRERLVGLEASWAHLRQTYLHHLHGFCWLWFSSFSHWRKEKESQLCSCHNASPPPPPASSHFSKQSAAASDGLKQWRYFSISTTIGRDGKGFPGVHLTLLVECSWGALVTFRQWRMWGTCGWRLQALAVVH